MADITKKLTDHVLSVKYEDLSPHVIEIQKRSLADALSVMMAATTLGAGSAPFTEYAEKLPGESICALLGSDKKVAPAQAALANGALIHALDYEDSHDKAPIHPNSVSTPALIALSEYMGGVSGKDLLTALVLASDISCRLDLGLTHSVLRYGWNMPPIHGAMGAAMAAARLLGLDYGQVLDTVSLTMCMSACSGEVANCSGSVIRTVRDGMAAQAVVNAALLAAQGAHARFDDPFEGRMGYYTMFAHGEYIPERVTDKLGEVYESEFISFKPWPACRGTHTAIDAIISLINEHGITGDEVEEVHIVKQKDAGSMVLEPRDIRYRPKAVSIAKFSLPFVVGSLMKDGDITLSTFDPEKLSDSEVLRIADKVTYELREDWGKDQSHRTQVTIRTKRGTFYKEEKVALGSADKPLSDEWMEKKFFDCAALSVKKYSTEHCKRIYDTIRGLDKIEDIRELTELF